MDGSLPSILWRLRSIEELLEIVGNEMADDDACKNCVHHLTAQFAEVGDDLGSPLFQTGRILVAPVRWGGLSQSASKSGGRRGLSRFRRLPSHM